MKGCLLLLSLIFVSFTIFAEPSAKEIVTKADSFRGYLVGSFSFEITLISYNPSKKNRNNKLEVKVKSGKSLIKFVSPARDKGKAILKEGRNMWFHIPRTRKIIRISPAQRLIGQASNGDVAGVNFHEEYYSTLIGEEMTENVLCYHLTLKALDKKVAYNKIEYWIEKKTGKPVKSMHYAISGKLLKIAFYKSFKKFGKEEKLQRLLLVDPLIKGKYTWMIYDHFEQVDLPDTLFRKENLNRL